MMETALMDPHFEVAFKFTRSGFRCASGLVPRGGQQGFVLRRRLASSFTFCEEGV